MRLIKLALLAVFVLLLVVLAMANRAPVELRLLPQDLGGLVGMDFGAVTLPLYVVIFAGILMGLVVGYIGEWLREHKLRSEAAKAKREAGKLRKEVDKMRKDAGGDDDVLALLEAPGR